VRLFCYAADENGSVFGLTLVNVERVCDNKLQYVIGSSGNTRVSGNRVCKAGVAVILTAAGAVAGASQAEAALYYWNDYDPSYYRPAQPVQPRRTKVRRNAIDKKTQAAEKETGRSHRAHSSSPSRSISRGSASTIPTDCSPRIGSRPG